MVRSSLLKSRMERGHWFLWELWCARVKYTSDRFAEKKVNNVGSVVRPGLERSHLARSLVGLPHNLHDFKKVCSSQTVLQSQNTPDFHSKYCVWWMVHLLGILDTGSPRSNPGWMLCRPKFKVDSPVSQAGVLSLTDVIE